MTVMVMMMMMMILLKTFATETTWAYLMQVEQKLFICIIFNADNSEVTPVLVERTNIKLAFIYQRLFKILWPEK